MGFEFSYKLIGTGWAEGSMTLNGNHFEFVASYLNEPLLELLEACEMLLQGKDGGKVVFMDEPGETLLDLYLVENEELQIKLLYSDKWLALYGEIVRLNFDKFLCRKRVEYYTNSFG
jgi:hypothetical protein